MSGMPDLIQLRISSSEIVALRMSRGFGREVLWMRAMDLGELDSEAISILLWR